MGGLVDHAHPGIRTRVRQTRAVKHDGARPNPFSQACLTSDPQTPSFRAMYTMIRKKFDVHFARILQGTFRGIESFTLYPVGQGDEANWLVIDFCTLN
jgi:hypothetical protein